jgi:hypothetical protein
MGIGSKFWSTSNALVVVLEACGPGSGLLRRRKCLSSGWIDAGRFSVVAGRPVLRRGDEGRRRRQRPGLDLAVVRQKEKVDEMVRLFAALARGLAVALTEAEWDEQANARAERTKREEAADAAAASSS